MKYTAKIQKHLNVYAWGWYTGMTQRDGMGREEGGGRRVQDEENRPVPWADQGLLSCVITVCSSA